MKHSSFRTIVVVTICWIFFFVAGQISFFLTQTVAQLFGVVVAWAIFAFAWNARTFQKNGYFHAVGLSFLFIGSVQLIQLLANGSQDIFGEFSNNSEMLFGMTAQLIEGIVFIGAPLFAGRKVASWKILCGVGCISLGLTIAAYVNTNPAASVERNGLALFARMPDLLVAILTGCALLFLYSKRTHFNKSTLGLLISSLQAVIGAEFLLASNLNFYRFADIGNLFLRLLASYLVYRAIIKNSFTDPYQLLFRDLSELKDAESEARKKAEIRAAGLEALRANLADMLDELDSGKLLEAILQRAAVLLNANGGELCLLDHATDELVVAACHNSSPASKGRRIANGEGVFGTVARNREPVIMHRNGFGDGRVPGYPEAFESWQGLMAVPLEAHGKLIGVIMVFGIDPGREFTSDDLHLFKLFAQQAAIAIRNIQFLDDARRRADTDSLTGLNNHRTFFESGRHAFDLALRYRHALSALMVDIDHFKNINDTYGHAAGDQVLVAIAHTCSQLFRKVDLVGRYGGEEFGIVLPETTVETAQEVAERLRRAVASMPVTFHNHALSVTISIGIATLAGGCFSFDEIIERADQALYVAKRSGRNRAVIWSGSLAAGKPALRIGSAGARHKMHRPEYLTLEKGNRQLHGPAAA